MPDLFRDEVLVEPLEQVFDGFRLQLRRRRLIPQVCAYSLEKLKGLEETYSIMERRVDHDALLFSVHTYYALVMKMLAAETAAIRGLLPPILHSEVGGSLPEKPRCAEG